MRVPGRSAGFVRLRMPGAAIGLRVNGDRPEVEPPAGRMMRQAISRLAISSCSFMRCYHAGRRFSMNADRPSTNAERSRASHCAFVAPGRGRRFVATGSRVEQVLDFGLRAGSARQQRLHARNGGR